MSQNGWWSTLIVSSWPVFSSIWLAFSQQTEFFTFFYCCHSELLPTLQFWAVIKCTAGASHPNESTLFGRFPSEMGLLSSICWPCPDGYRDLCPFTDLESRVNTLSNLLRVFWLLLRHIGGICKQVHSYQYSLFLFLNVVVFIRGKSVIKEAACDLLPLGLYLLTLFWSVTNCHPSSHNQHAEHFNKRPTLCFKDLTRWQISTNRGTLNPVIVSQSCCPVIYSCCPATASVFLMPCSLSQSYSVMRTWLPEGERSCTVCVRERVRGMGRQAEGKGDRWIDGWTDGWAQREA